MVFFRDTNRLLRNVWPKIKVKGRERAVECVNLHIRGERKGGGVWGLQGDFDDGMMLEVTTNMETWEAPRPSRLNRCWSHSAQQFSLPLL